MKVAHYIVGLALLVGCENPYQKITEQQKTIREREQQITTYRDSLVILKDSIDGLNKECELLEDRCNEYWNLVLKQRRHMKNLLKE